MAEYIIETKDNRWEVICGLEIHCQIISKSKMFSGASTVFGADANEHVSFVDAGMPGMLPVLNERCVHQAVKTGLGLNAKINKYSQFSRKNYFYADLPQGYQITQFQYPIVGEGKVVINLEDGSSKEIGIERMHIEQDAGKSIHDIDPKKTYIDLNRAGVGLMEIVTKPDFRSPEEAGAFLKKLRSILRYLETCDGNMDEGSMRCDVNVSVRKVGEDGYRTRCEMKNVNSVKFVMSAIENEARRHVEVYEAGGKIEQETRQFDPLTGQTRVMRKKEFAHDYRYFPEPDLVPIVISDEWIAKVKANQPELRTEKLERYQKEFDLPKYDAEIITGHKKFADLFEAATKLCGKPKKVSNWIMVETMRLLKENNMDPEDIRFSPVNLAKLINLADSGSITNTVAKEVFELIFKDDIDPEKYVEEKGLKTVNDEGALRETVQKILAENPQSVEDYHNGKEKAIGFLVGQTMKAMKGKANPALVNQILKELL